MSKNILGAIAIAGVVGLSALPAQAQLKQTFANGDLILGFQQTGGGAVAQFNLGTAFSYRDLVGTGTNQVNFANIDAQLDSAYGTTWFQQSNIFGGAAAVRSNTASAIQAPQNGDKNRTIYFTRERTGVGSIGFAQSDYFSGNQTGVDTIASNIFQLNTSFAANSTNGVGLYSDPSAVSNSWEDFNQFIPLTTNLEPAFGSINGGAQDQYNTGFTSIFGINNVVWATDLYRQVRYPGTSTADAPSPAGYIGTLVLDASGNISFFSAVPEPGSAGLIGIAAAAFAFVRRRNRR